jgi:ABC-type Fe3+/spermidine/putrescine transport system ATPase subunit
LLELDQVEVQRPGFNMQASGLRLAAAERVTLIGPSGGGKSTLLRALVGLEPQAKVRGLRWQSQDITRLPPHQRPFGWLPQELGLWPHLRASAHVAFARTRARSIKPNDADMQILEQVGLMGRAQSLPGQLSGGERQRLAFARVIAMKPAWAVLDEPFSHLDPVIASELSGSFKALATQLAMGLIQVTHQMYAPEDDDWIWAMEDGRLTQTSRWADVKQSPATPWIARFVALQH